MAKKYYRHAVQMALLIRGRDTRNAQYDEALFSVMTRMPVAESNAVSSVCTGEGGVSGCCEFCGVESSAGTCVTLKLCGRCKMVAYCGPHCQKLHWPLHKKPCKLHRVDK